MIFETEYPVMKGLGDSSSSSSSSSSFDPASAIASLIPLLAGIIPQFFKPDLKKIEASNIVDRIEATILKPNLAAWNNLDPKDKSLFVQQQALSVFDQAWNAVLQGCGNPQLQQAGINCVVDRQRGSTKGYDWFSIYRDPIANDNEVHDNPVNAVVSSTTDLVSNIGSQVSNVFSSVSSGGLLIPGVLLLGGIWALSKLGSGD